MCESYISSLLKVIPNKPVNVNSSLKIDLKTSTGFDFKLHQSLRVLFDPNSLPFQRDLHGGNRGRKTDARHRRRRMRRCVTRSLRQSRRQRRDPHRKHLQFGNSAGRSRR